MNNETEVWKSCCIVGFPNYEVSNLGNVRTSITHELKNITVHQNGYKMVCLYNDYYHKVFNVGRLVLLVFEPIAEAFEKKKLDADHINEDKSDNRLVNLRWLSHKDNCKSSNYKLHLKRNKRHTKGIIVVYPDLSKEYYKTWKSCPLNNQQIYNMLHRDNYSKKYNCWVFYAGNVPEKYEYLFENEEKLF